MPRPRKRTAAAEGGEEEEEAEAEAEANKAEEEEAKMDVLEMEGMEGVERVEGEAMTVLHRANGRGVNGPITASSRRTILLYLEIRRRRRRRVKRRYRSVCYELTCFNFYGFCFLNLEKVGGELRTPTLEHLFISALTHTSAFRVYLMIINLLCDTGSSHDTVSMERGGEQLL